MLEMLLQIDAGIIDTVVNRDPSWDKKIINFIIQIGFLVGMIYAVYKGIKYKNHPDNKGKTLKDLVTKDPRGLLNNILVISSALEIAALVTMALDRNVTLIAALTRYAILGFFEMLAAYIAMDKISDIFEDGVVNIRFKKKDGKPDKMAKFKNDSGAVISAIVAFSISFVCTYAIFFLYMESEGATNLLSGNSAVPSIQFKANKVLEWGTIVTIFCTPVITLVNAYFEITKMNKNKKLHDRINDKKETREDRKIMSRQDELKELIKDSSGILKEGFEEELKELEGNV